MPKRRGAKTRGGGKKSKFPLTVKGHPMQCTLFTGINGKPALTCHTPAATSAKPAAKTQTKRRGKR